MRIKFEAHVMPNNFIPFVFHREMVLNYNSYNIANWHRNIEVLYFYQGSGSVFCDTNCFNVNSGDIIVVNSNSVHYVKTDDIVKYSCLIIDAEFCLENCINIDEIIFENKVTDKLAKDKYEKIIDEFIKENEFYNAGIRSSVIALLVYLARNYTLITDDSKKILVGKRGIENIKLATGFIKANYTEKLLVEDIASAVGLSKYHFIREFKKITGMTPVNYVNMLRCEKAKKMLDEKDFAISDVYRQCGFENSSYFSKVFKKFTGVVPIEYLKNSKLKNFMK